MVRKIKSEKRLCLICMEEHEMHTVKVIETETFKDKKVFLWPLMNIALMQMNTLKRKK